MANKDEAMQQFLGAIDEIIKARTQDNKASVKCKIINADKAEQGEYMVDDGSRKFTVYSDLKTYKAGDYVYVFIPDDKENKEYRYILGKCIAVDTPYYTYVSPTETYVNMTDDLFSEQEKGYGLMANGDVTTIPLGTIECNLSGYDRLVLAADFMTWLSTYNLVSGAYGLRLDVIYEEYTTVTSKTRKVAIFYLDSKDMYGNVYGYETYYRQEAIFDISPFENIVEMRVTFYQNKNFKKANGDPIENDYPANDIFVRDISVSAGYDLSSFTEDKILLQTTTSQTYASFLTDTMKEYMDIVDEKSLTDKQITNLIRSFNTKDMKLRWIRLKDDGLEQISSLRDKPENVIIHWYQYTLEQGVADDLAGAFWVERFDWQNSFDISGFLPDITKEKERIKVIIEELPADMDRVKFESINIETTQDPDEQEYYTLYKGSTQYHYSPELEFINESYVPDYGTIDLINGLRIDVDTAGNRGVYRFYNTDGSINASSEATKKRLLTASYSSLVTGDTKLDKAERITWVIPQGPDSMIANCEKGVEYTEEEEKAGQVLVFADRVEITRYGIMNSALAGEEEADTCQQVFRIKNYYSQKAANNTVRCQLVRDNKLYETSAELFFGTHGTQGTDYSFMLKFSNGENGLFAKKGASAYIQPIIYDSCDNDITNTGVFRITSYEWYSRYKYDADANKEAITIAASDNDKGFRQITVQTDNIEECRYHILKVTAEGAIHFASSGKNADGTDKLPKTVRLFAYLPIPVKAQGYKMLAMNGADIIQYSSSGTDPKKFEDPYSLSVFNEETGLRELLEAKWYTSFGQDCADANTVTGASFYPRVSEDGKLTVPTLHLSGTGVQMSVDAHIGNKIVWTQPLRISTQSYGSPLLNSWDGNLTFDEKNGTILSAMIGAGVKNIDNSFSGVLMGDMSKTGDPVEGDLSSYYNGIGLYGLDANTRSFGLNVNGKAFFGRAGRGQILIDGNKGTITSALFETQKRGLKLDLDDGTIESLGYNGASGQAKVIIDPTVESTESKPYFQVRGDNNVNLLYFGPKAQQIASYNYSQSGQQGTLFDLQKGILTSYGANGSYVRLSSGENNSKKFFEIFDGNANQPIFVATGSTSYDTDMRGERSYSDTSSESLADISAVNTYLTNRIKSVNVNNGTSATGYPKTTWSVNYRVLRKETKNKVTTEYYKFVVFKDETAQLEYSGESLKYPVTNRQGRPAGQEKLVGDILESNTRITVYHTSRVRYTADIPMTDIKDYLNTNAIKNIDANVAAYVESKVTIDKLKDEVFIHLVQTANAIPTTVYSTEDVHFDYICSNFTQYKQVVELTGTTNGAYYLQSSNYDGKMHGTKLDLSNSIYTTYGKDGSYVRIKGNGDPFFQIYDIYGANTSSGERTGKDIFRAEGSNAEGNSGQYFLQSSNFQTGGGVKIGTKLDLTRGQYLSYGTYGRIEMKPEESIFFKLSTNETDGSSKTLMVVQQNPDNDGDGTSGQYYLQSVDFNATGHTGTRLDLQHGKYISYGSYGRVTINSNGSTVFKIDYRSGAGDINFVNLITIGENAYWIRSIDYAKPEIQKGSCWNLDTGAFETYNVAGAIRMTPRSDAGLFQVVGKPDGGVERILMNVGNSAYYLQSAYYPDGTQGSYWNLQDGKFETKNSGGKILMQPSVAGSLFKVSGFKDDGTEVTLMNVGSSSYYLQSIDYGTNSGIRFDLGNGGKITAYNFKIYATGSEGNITIDSGATTYPLDINGKFRVQWNGDTSISGDLTVSGDITLDGILTVNSGKIQSGDEGAHFSFETGGGFIGGWNFTKDSFTSDTGNTTLYSSGRIEIEKGEGYFRMGGDTVHPEVSGLNVTGNKGISFRTDDTQIAALDTGTPTDAEGTYLITEGNHAVTGYLHVGGKTNFRGDIYLKEGTGFVVDEDDEKLVGNNVLAWAWDGYKKGDDAEIDVDLSGLDIGVNTFHLEFKNGILVNGYKN